MSGPSEHELAAADAYMVLTHLVRLGDVDTIEPGGLQIRAGFLAGIAWNETRCRVCDTAECGTWYCHNCHKLVENGTPSEQAREEVLEGLLAACRAALNWLVIWAPHANDRGRLITEQLKAAIAKAEPQPEATKGGDCRP